MLPYSLLEKSSLICAIRLGGVGVMDLYKGALMGKMMLTGPVSGLVLSVGFGVGVTAVCWVTAMCAVEVVTVISHLNGG